MGALSDYLEGQVLNWIHGTTMPAAPTTIYIGLFTAQPGDTGTSGSPADGTEVSGGSYARVAVTSSSGTSAPAASSTTQFINITGSVTFPQATASWGTVTGWGIWDASTVGHLLWFGAISPTQAISTNQTPSFNANALTLSID